MDARLVILLERAATVPEAQAALRYAVTAAAMDVAVEVHAVGASVALLRRDHADADWRSALDELLELGAQLYACPHALAGQGMRPEDLRDDVAGVRGAASLLAAGLAPGGRFMVF
ncbi:DsrE family protein [Duganella callida]|uniref:Uncharacterized protein n=1 Tax=Duganella callida TaxID=2561932 RepID=A0A4Y9S9C0_9BURK|nr:DsrE family protein [Duganella callida]TFW18344.1 hypothetical protein E4L98_18750 [Duganella callida]